jgi:MFS family permease
MNKRLGGLWQHPNFLKFWAGETVSVFGSQITLLALPLTAVLMLGATPLQMGILGAVEVAPFLFISLFAGVWVDRWRLRPLMIMVDIGRAILLGSIPAVYALGWLSIEYLYVVAVLTGVFTVFFDVAYQSYLPVLVERDKLVEGNGKLEVSRSVAQIAGPGLAGTLVQLVSAPVTLALDAISFAFSALFLGLIKHTEPARAATQAKRNIWREIGEGMGVVFGSRYLRPIAACTGIGNLFGNIGSAVYTIYLVRELHLDAVVLGLIFGLGSIGALLGALMNGWLTDRLGLGPTILLTAVVFCIGPLATPLANGPVPVLMLILTAGYFITSWSSPIYNINQLSLRQAITPRRLLGRMNASMRFLVWGTMPVGSLLGGLLGELIGLRATLLVAALGGFLSVLPILFSPVRTLQKQPDPIEEEAPPQPIVTTL